MFSAGHFIFILISIIFIVAGTIFCRKKKPPVRKLLVVCLVIGLISEFFKVMNSIEIVPVVKPMVENGMLVYKETGAFTPYLEAEHFPFELCSYQIPFMFLALILKDRKWLKRLYAVMFTTCVVGGGIAVLLSSAAQGLTTVGDFLFSVEVWRAFLYHAMLIILGIYIGESDECDLHFKDVKWALIAIVVMDFATLYMNSMMSTPYYSGDTLVGVGNAINYFSSYNNPLAIVMSNKMQLFIYLIIRLGLALLLITLANLPLLRKDRKGKNASRQFEK